MANPNLAIADQFVAAVFAGDQATLRTLIDDNFLLKQDKNLPYGGEYRGADGFFTFLEAFGQAYEIEALEKTGTFVSNDDPNIIVFEFSFRGKLAESGIAFNTTMLEPWTFRNGKVIAITPHWFEVPGTVRA